MEEVGSHAIMKVITVNLTSFVSLTDEEFEVTAGTVITPTYSMPKASS